jgi:hypothetical protein
MKRMEYWYSGMMSRGEVSCLQVYNMVNNRNIGESFCDLIAESRTAGMLED